VDSRVAGCGQPALICANTIHRVCRRKSRPDFGPRPHRSYPQRNAQAASACLWKTCAGRASAKVFPQIPNGSGRLRASTTNSPQRAARRNVAGTREQAARLEESAAHQVPAGYHSPVCSNTGDAIDRIAAAIDQLATDARDAEAGASGDELTARVATLWQMLSDLDPELARRARRYTRPVDGGPSA
jgi:hypothetical protein